MVIREQPTSVSGKMSFAQRVKGIFKPGYMRQVARAQYNKILAGVMKDRAYYQGAESNRLNANWSTSGLDVNKMLQSDLTALRNRSRWLCRNTALGQAVINSFQMFVVGDGMSPQARVASEAIVVDESNGRPHLEYQEDDLWNERAEELWRRWERDCDIRGSESSPESFVEVQNLLMRKLVEDGEILVNIVKSKLNPVVPLYLEIIETDNLDGSRLYNGDNPITLGVETDKATGRPVAYWIGDPGSSKRYPAKDMIHVFDRERPGQVRGVPMMAPVIQKFYQLDEYVDAELIGVKIAACFSAFLKMAPGVTDMDGSWVPGSGTQATDGNGNNISHLQPGMIGTLPAGAELDVVSPQKPGATYGMFTEHIERMIGAGVRGGLSYEMLSRDTSKATFAGGRLAQQMDYQMFRARQGWFQRKFCTPIWRAFVDTAILAGKLAEPGSFNNIDWYRHDWVTTGWSVGINPTQEVNAARDRIRAGISTLADESMQATGRDWETNLMMRAKEERRAKQLGLTLTSDASVSIMNGVDDQQGDASEEEATAQAQSAATSEA